MKTPAQLDEAYEAFVAHVRSGVHLDPYTFGALGAICWATDRAFPFPNHVNARSIAAARRIDRKMKRLLNECIQIHRDQCAFEELQRKRENHER